MMPSGEIKSAKNYDALKECCKKQTLTRDSPQANLAKFYC